MFVAGAVAGLAAAFGAPAAGVLFAFEEMKSRRDTSLIVAACASAIGAHLMIHCLRHGAHPSVCGVRSSSAVLFLDRGAGRRRLWSARRGIQQDPCCGFTIGSRTDADPGSLEGLAAAAARRMPRAVRASADRRGREPDHLCGRARCGPEDAYPLLAFKYLFAQYSTVASIPGGLLMPILCLGALWGGSGRNCRLGVGRARAGVRFGAAVCACSAW